MLKKAKYENGIFPVWADYLSQCLVIYSIVMLTLESEPTLHDHPFFHTSELWVTAFFAAEYVLRVIMAKDRWGYVKSWHGIIDVVATAPIILTHGLVDFRFARVIRLVRLLRLLKFVRYVDSVSYLTDAIKEIKGELIVFSGCILVIIYAASVGIYFFEHESQPEAFGSIIRSMWWAVVTLTTVGYGDVHPITAGGKIFTGIVLFMGLGIIAIPSGLLAASLTATKERRNQDKKEDSSENDQNSESESKYEKAG